MITMDHSPDGYTEPPDLDPHAIDDEIAQSAPSPSRRLERQVARIAGARFLAARPGDGLGGTPVIVIDDGADDAPAWLAVASGSRQLEALQLGASGVVEGSIGGPALAAAIEAARQGLVVLPPELLRKLLPPDGAARNAKRGPNGGPSLTPREAAVLQLLSEGATNKMIARALEISVHTAKFHVASILDKLDAVTRTDAVAQGIRQGLLML